MLHSCARPRAGLVTTHASAWPAQAPASPMHLTLPVQDVEELFMKRLRQYPARSLWRSYAPTHFGGRTGTYMGIDEEHLQEMPTRRHCEPAEHGEYW